MRLLYLLGLWVILGADNLVDPIYPPNAISGGTVVAELHSVSGIVKSISIHAGEEPFVSSAKAALDQWHLHPERDGNDLVIVYFRQPNLFYLNDASESIAGGKAEHSTPYPKSIVGPSYPAQTFEPGAVILRMDISAAGSVEDVNPLKSAGDLTGVSIAAVRKWKFMPAKNDTGAEIRSHVYAVLVYRSPIVERKR
jgi:hypothetical protein